MPYSTDEKRFHGDSIGENSEYTELWNESIQEMKDDGEFVILFPTMYRSQR